MSDQRGDSTKLTRPVGSGEYVVREAECLNSIAWRAGFFWQTIWNDPANADIRAARKDHNLLLPGDRLHIPEKTLRNHTCVTDRTHRFVLKGVPSLLKLRLLDHDSPESYANKRYIVNIDGRLKEGTIDADGNIELEIDPAARKVILMVNDEEFDLRVSGLDPIDSVRGALQRLQSLGFYHGDIADEWNDLRIAALKRFQSAHVLTSNDQRSSGEYDSNTQAKLAKVYGC